MLLGLSILALSFAGCCACRQGVCGQSGHFQQPNFQQPIMQQPVMQQPVMQQPVMQQPIIGDGYQQPGASLPNWQQTQQGLGQFGQNLGSRFSNGILNRGVNRVIDGAISGF